MEYIFETEHLKFRKFEIEDAQCLYEIHLEEEVKKWIPNESYADIEETQSAINFYVDCVNNKHLPYVLAVELKETGDLIGDTGVNEVEGHLGEVEIGYVICKMYSGKGYATEIVKECLKRMVMNLLQKNLELKMILMVMECWYIKKDIKFQFLE